jgi:hypothetical protein
MFMNIYTILCAKRNKLLVLGALDQRGYNRPEPRNETLTREQQKNRPIEEKESNRWPQTMETAGRDIPEGTKVIHV